jgi:4-aminobutyrate aminotransferase-like enzyme
MAHKKLPVKLPVPLLLNIPHQGKNTMSTTLCSSTDADALVEVKKRHIWPCVYHFYRDPPVIARGEGAYLFDTQGRQYLDCYSGVGVMSAGHSNPKILAAVQEQMQQLCHTTTIYLSEPMLRLSERLAELLPEGLDSFFFCASGSEANEAALLLASLATGRNEFITFENSLHGRTKAAMSATALPMWRTDPDLLDSFHKAPQPNEPNCLEVVAKLLQDHPIAAVMFEPIQGNGGIHVMPEGFLPRLKKLCQQHGTLLIADEVQTGINRTGDWLASTGLGVTPDIVTLAKALGNGFPIAVTATSSQLAQSYRKPGASTFGGNPVSAAAALAVLDYHAKHGLGDRARQLGGWLVDTLRHQLDKLSRVQEIRGRGLMVGVEIVEGDEQQTADYVTDVLEVLKDAGFLLGRTGPGRNVLTIMPPLVVEQSDLQTLVDAIEQVLIAT